MSANKFDEFTVPQLKHYLQDRGVTVSGYRRALLLELANAVDRCQLPTDPDYQQIDTAGSIIEKLQVLGINSSPWSLPDFTTDSNPFM